MKWVVCIFLLGCTCLQTNVAYGRYRHHGYRHYRHAFGYRHYRHAYRHGYGYGHSAGRSQGLASLIRANSNAKLQYEETRSKYIDNRLKWQKAYTDMQNNHQAYVEQKHVKEAADRDAWVKIGSSGAPARLTRSQFDPSTGHIAWPEALRGDDFAANRKRIEEQFVLRTHAGGGSHTADEVGYTTDRMLEQLKERIDEIPANKYISARKFLDSLSYEAQQLETK